MKLSRHSHKIVTVTCDYCQTIYQRAHRDYLNNKERNNNHYICLKCSRHIKHSGRKNPNCKHQFDDNFFNTVDTEEKAYLLGWIASDGHISKSGFVIKIHSKDVLILTKLNKIICSENLIKTCEQRNMIAFNINSKQISKRLCELLKIKPGPKAKTVQFPELPKELRRHFIRGYFDGDGTISNPNGKKNYPVCSIASSSSSMLKSIQDNIDAKSNIYSKSIEWNNNNALDFLFYLYNDTNLFLQRKYNRYVKWSSWIKSRSSKKQEINFYWNKTQSNAIPPSKLRASDSGYDLTLIDIKKDFGQTKLYGTGIKIRPDYGWYFDLVPRSSISKTGYILANNTGIIDRSYVGEILVPLIKIDETKPDLELPCRLVQIIPRQIQHLIPIETDSLETTERGANGFGSSGS